MLLFLGDGDGFVAMPPTVVVLPACLTTTDESAQNTPRKQLRFVKTTTTTR